MRLYETGKLDFLKRGTDTIWMLESLLTESGIIVGRIWNSHGVTDYNTYEAFSPYICRLVESWDTAAIRMEAETQARAFHSMHIYATRVISAADNPRIDTISFTELFQWKRDIPANDR
ncbi:hypothetical protein F0L74_25690 [Chitinophaga agrisoli]|uniref:Uncharacterized protein n=2 Tax=Chitinophaga agrisoli TaxID=2607653 RepID=A0A5B2VLJ8_9BACT|nr:hypothetical protein F0L74_25690 [Chitinophaga agrisoli]